MADDRQQQRLRQTFEALRQSLEEAESALIEYEETLDEDSTVRPQSRRGLELLSIPEVCQELGMGKSWVYKRIRSGELPSVNARAQHQGQAKGTRRVPRPTSLSPLAGGCPDRGRGTTNLSPSEAFTLGSVVGGGSGGYAGGGGGPGVCG